MKRFLVRVFGQTRLKQVCYFKRLSTNRRVSTGPLSLNDSFSKAAAAALSASVSVASKISMMFANNVLKTCSTSIKFFF